jgi:hypothetical protein
MLPAQVHTGISLVYDGIMFALITLDGHRFIPASKKAFYYLLLWWADDFAGYSCYLELQLTGKIYKDRSHLWSIIFTVLKTKRMKQCL